MSHLFPTYQRWEVEPKLAKGTKLLAVNGKEYLDFTSGIGVCNLGHRPQNVYETVKKQLDQFWHVSNLFPVSIQEEAANLLATSSGLDFVFFANSGAEANEGAIKLARKATGRNKIITFQKSFHGRTFATMAATGQDKVKTGFGPMLESFVYVPFNEIESLKKEMGNDVAAIMLEIVQGEGGINVVQEDFLDEIGKLCTQYGALLIIDEIQTGIGRTGKSFAFKHFNIKPDIVTVAKGLGSGFPIGAVIGKHELGEYFTPGSHGSTFGGNPISISAAIATMKTIFQASFLKEIEEKSQLLFKKLNEQVSKLSIVKDIRGLGLMIGIELTQEVGPILKELRDEGLLVLSAGEQVIRLLPPLNVSNDEIDQAVELLIQVLKR
ncbi:acetylornithine transaminase [Bacillus aquiflavi]|uniref:Acetylornithine aminotransferase n=1 Tax=Bacillus aquiflavi TaxID=2672567 RepID=A0A6B3VV37_9BACI|nr:acetylornithine transaminase [Bacillus aquiflavi]MBA4536474.1 acetylornithine transaminase [Bacillus aquiflavi]NEY80842.1 acetylornithine transaminase [Bacillus aquiflavi]